MNCLPLLPSASRPVWRRFRPVLFLFLFPSLAGVASPAALWVSPEGNDAHPGTVDAPLRTLDMALRQVREWRRLEDPRVEAGAFITLRGGTYPLLEPVRIRPEDSGTGAGPTVIRAAEGERPILSGGLPVTGWERVEGPVSGLPASAAGRVWVAPAPLVGGRPLSFRDLWIGERRGIRAREADGGQLERLLAWDKEKREGWIPWPEGLQVRQPGQMELVVHQMWAIAILRVKTLEIVGEQARLTFHEPESRVQFEHPWPPVVISESGNSAFYLSNSLAFLDEPGEWYQSVPDGRLYYWPRADEDLRAVPVVAPVLETLVEIHGTLDRPVAHLQLEGLQFSHTTWMRPSEAGHVPLQAGMYLLDAYKLLVPGTPDKKGLENQAWIGRKPAAVELTASQHLCFAGCRFEHLAASGLDFIKGSFRDVVEGNLFRDIGGSGLVAGAFPDGGFETHLPYDPADERELCRFLRIANNLVTDVANEDWGCVGILAGYVRDSEIAHNTINDVSYTGISLGWGWTKSVNCMRNNRVHANHIHHFGKHMYDTGGIYTLSPQPNSFITANRVHSIYRPAYVHDPNHWSYLYLDEGSSFIIVQDNWTEGLKYSTNANGPGNTWENNGPEVAEEIRAAAGLQPAFRHLLRFARVGPESPVQ